jgi:hypothetical protein
MIKKGHYYHAVPVPVSMKVVLSTLDRKTTGIRVGQTVKALDDAIEGSPDVMSVQFDAGTYGKLFAFQLEKEVNKRETEQKSYHHRSRFSPR